MLVLINTFNVRLFKMVSCGKFITFIVTRTSNVHVFLIQELYVRPFFFFLVVFLCGFGGWLFFIDVIGCAVGQGGIAAGV